MLRLPLRLALFALALALLSGCDESDNDAPVLRLGYSPADETLKERQHAYESLRDYLSSTIGYDVQLVKINSYQPAITAMKARQIDIMNFGSQAYLIAERSGAAEAFVLRGNKDGKPQVYQSVVIAPSALPHDTIEEALADVTNMRILYTNQASTSGYLVAKSYYDKMGIDPLHSFRSVSFTNSHSLSVLKISNQQADLANVSSQILESLIAAGKVNPDTIKLLWKSGDIPNGPVAFRPHLPEPTKAKIRQAYLDLPHAAPETWRQIRSTHREEDFIYIAASPEAFDTLRRANSPESPDPSKAL